MARASSGAGVPEDAERVLGFWLDEVGPEGWYAVDEAVDRRCAEQFGAVMADAAAGRLADWRSSPRGVLAPLVLLDQFPRNVYRGTARAYATDGRARALAIAAIARGDDLKVAEPERQFFYLPLEHSESLADQDRCLRLVLLRMPEHGERVRRYAVMHREVIRRFGRFPSRNAALGRTDTAAEREYRAAGGYMG